MSAGAVLFAVVVVALFLAGCWYVLRRPKTAGEQLHSEEVARLRKDYETTKMRHRSDWSGGS